MSDIDIPPEILNMPVGDRLQLVCKIWDSISHDGLPPVSDEVRSLIDDRIAEADANPEEMIPANEVFDELGKNE